MKKTAVAVALALITAFLAAGCGRAREKRFDYSELNRRIAEARPEYVFTEKGMLFSGETYYAWYSLHGPNDMLLTMRGDENGRLERISLSVLAEAPDETREDFRALALLLAETFIPELSSDAFLSETGLNDAETPPLRVYRQGHYSASLLTTNAGTTLTMEYGKP